VNRCSKFLSYGPLDFELLVGLDLEAVFVFVLVFDYVTEVLLRIPEPDLLEPIVGSGYYQYGQLINR
jgi:hypothetical protein